MMIDENMVNNIAAISVMYLSEDLGEEEKRAESKT